MNSLCQMISFTFSISDDNKYSSLKWWKWNILNLVKFEVDERNNFESSKISISNYCPTVQWNNEQAWPMKNVGRVRCFASSMDLQSNFVWLIQTIEFDKCAFSECRTFRSKLQPMGECVRNVHLPLAHELWWYRICTVHSAQCIQQCWCIYGMRMQRIEWKTHIFWILNAGITKIIQ